MNKLKDLRTLISIKANDEGQLPNEIEILQAGMWRTPYHGNFQVTVQDLNEYVQNFANDVRASSSTHGLPIDFEHNTHGGAAGWLTKLEVRGTSLWATIDWNKKGAEAIANKEYKFFSPEFQPEDYEDPERAGVFYNNVCMGGGLTTRPLFKGLTPVTANDADEKEKKVLTPGLAGSTIYIKPVVNHKEENMKLQDLLEKKASELTKEEREFITANEKDLTAEQRKAFDFLDTKETKEEKEARLASEKKEADNKKKEAAEKAKKGADQVVISASEHEALVKKANEGAEALERLNRKEASEKLSAVLFASDSPRLPVAAKDDVVDFYMTLNKGQKEAFDGIMEKLPEVKMFSEIGSDQGASVKAAEALDKKANELMEKNKDLSYSDALRQASEANPELAKQHAEIKE